MTLRPNEKRALIVIGMHRSGTSATTGALRCLGVQLGKKLYSGHQNINAKGYFEHSDIADTNEDALLSIGSSWDDILLKEEGWWNRSELQLYASKMRHYIRRDFSRSQLWALKDPRVCRLLPWWLDILAGEGIRPYFLFVVRSPAAVFRSLERRDGFSREKSYLLWALHYLEAEQWSRGHPRAFLGFDNFLDDPVGQFRSVEQTLGLRFPVPPEDAAASLGDFLSRDLRNHLDEGAQPVADSEVLALARDLQVQLNAAALGGAARLDQAAIADIWDRLRQFQDKALPGPMKEHLQSLGTSRGHLQITVGRLVRSWSWYTGKPIRFFERLINRDV